MLEKQRVRPLVLAGVLATTAIPSTTQASESFCAPGTLYLTSSGGRVVLLDPRTGVTSTRFSGLTLLDGVVIDAARSKAYASSPQQGKLWELDLATGGSRLVLDAIFQWRPRNAAVDATGTTAWVVDDLNQALWRVDLATGSRLLWTSGLIWPRATPG